MQILERTGWKLVSDSSCIVQNLSPVLVEVWRFQTAPGRDDTGIVLQKFEKQTFDLALSADKVYARPYIDGDESVIRCVVKEL